MRDRYISPSAIVGSKNHFGRGVIVGDDVVIGDGNMIGDYAIIEGCTQLGSGNYIGDHVSIGKFPTNSRIKYEFVEDWGTEQSGKICIGNNTVIREFTNISLPTAQLTSIGNDCYVMPHCHVSHDVLMEDKVILSNHCSPGGHTRILKGAHLGKNVQTHPRTVIGQYAMLGISAVVIRNVLPAVTAVGNPARLLGVNRTGLERNGFDAEEIDAFAAAITQDMIMEALPPAVRNVYLHFKKVMEDSRDSRTLPSIDLSDLIGTNVASGVA